MTDASDRLRLARSSAGFNSAAEAARAMGIDYPTYAGHENGSRGFGAQAARYARRFGVSLEWLIEGRGPARHSEWDQMFHELPPEKQREALRFLEFLKHSS